MKTLTPLENPAPKAPLSPKVLRKASWLLRLALAHPEAGPGVRNPEHLYLMSLGRSPVLRLTLEALLLVSKLRRPWLSPEEVKALLWLLGGVNPRSAGQALESLVRAGLVEEREGRYRLLREALLREGLGLARRLAGEAGDPREGAGQLQGAVGEEPLQEGAEAASRIKEEEREKDLDPVIGAPRPPAHGPEGRGEASKASETPSLKEEEPLRRPPEAPRREAAPRASLELPRPRRGRPPRPAGRGPGGLPLDARGRPHVKALLWEAGLWEPFRDVLLQEHYPSTHPYLAVLSWRVERVGSEGFLTALRSLLEDVARGGVVRPRRLLDWKLARLEAGKPVYLEAHERAARAQEAAPPPPPPPPAQFRELSYGDLVVLKSGEELPFVNLSGPRHLFVELPTGAVRRVPLEEVAAVRRRAA